MSPVGADHPILLLAAEALLLAGVLLLRANRCRAGKALATIGAVLLLCWGIGRLVTR